jgi:hypothetical protein
MIKHEDGGHSESHGLIMLDEINVHQFLNAANLDGKCGRFQNTLDNSKACVGRFHDCRCRPVICQNRAPHSEVSAMSCHVLSCLVFFCLVLPCLVLPCLILSCLVLSCLSSCLVVLSCLLVLSSYLLFCLVSDSSTSRINILYEQPYAYHRCKSLKQDRKIKD